MPDESARDSIDASRSPGLKPRAASDAKSELRERFKVVAKEFFASHPAAELEKTHSSIAASLTNYARQNFSESQLKNIKIAIYEPMKVELPVKSIVSQSAVFENPKFLYPQIDGEKMWFTDEMGALAEPEIIIVPGLFVDKAGNRLGRGKGYYDRFLAASQVPLARRIFLGYDFQFIERVPVTPQDESVTAVP